MSLFEKFTECGPSIDEDQVQAFEKEFGIELPSDYRMFLVKRNGHSTRQQRFVPDKGNGFMLQKLFPIGVEPPFELHHYNRYSETPRKFVDIGKSICGDTLSIQVKGLRKGSVGWFDHEVERAPFLKLADSFTEFLEGLSDE